jgi:hypothetical protein
MINLQTIEILGSIFSISGAISMSFSSKENTNPLYYAFYLFFFSNLLFLFLFTSSGIVPIMLQMIFFFISSINGIIKTSNNLRKDYLIIATFLLPYLLFFINYFFFSSFDFNNISWEVKPLEAFASSLAIIGSFVLASSHHITRSYAFIIFFIADTILAYVGYTHSMYAFMTQAIFFLGTSSFGYYNTMKAEINSIFLRRKNVNSSI